MGSAVPNSRYSYLRGMHETTTNKSNAMASNATKGKAPATSVYPSPADEVISTFSAPSSPVLNEQQITPLVRRDRITLPPISSLVNQMPSPSSSPQLAVASYRSPADAFLKSPIKFSRSQDAPLFPDRPMASNDLAKPQPLFGGSTYQTQLATLPELDQQRLAPSENSSVNHLARSSPQSGASLQPLTLASTFKPVPQPQQSDPLHRFTHASPGLGGSKHSSRDRATHLPGRRPKQRQTAYDIQMRTPVSSSAPRYGRNDFWARQIADPATYVLPLLQDWHTVFEATKAALPQATFPIATPAGVFDELKRVSPADAATFAARHAISSGRRDQHDKRKADSVVDMPPPKRTRKVSASKPLRPSVSPREAPLDAPEKKFRRRTNDATKARAPADKVARDFSIYPDYCPPLSTLDSDQVNFPNIEWKATPQDVTNHEDCHLLHPKEIPIVSKLVLTPSDYIYIKRRFFANRLGYAKKRQPFNINAAQLACKGADEHGITGIDVNKTSRLHKAFDRVGWLNEKHMQRFL
ncbi:hypothetical protein E4T43_02099 [Aureobasidium subglaciale]|nr:hypothetical protein E4T43_02099 [Aureobasidium subglaciale]